MFNIDLLNNVGLQKNISRQKVTGDANKGNIVFEESIPDEEINNDAYDNVDNSNSSLLSYIIAVISVFLLTVFAFVDYQEIFEIKLNDDIVISSLISLFNESETKKMVNYISISENIKLSLSIDDLDKIKLIKTVLKEDSYTYKVYEDYGYNYNVEIISNGATFRKNDNKTKKILASIMEKHKNRANVRIEKSFKSITFRSDHKTIFNILEQILSLGTIKIFPESNSDFIILEFSY